MCTAHARPTATRGVAQLSLDRRSARGPRRGPALPASAARGAARACTTARGGTARLPYSDDLTGAWETTGESVAGAHRRVDGGVARLVV
jgi:hypothetical protein